MMEGGGREGEAFPPTLLNKEKAAMKIIIVFIISIAASVVLAQGAPGAAPAPAGWVDHDGDGRHDTFRDQNGDGINDLNNQSYAHRYGWVDENGDGFNDLAPDADGDGIPNGVDPDYAPPMDGTGNRLGADTGCDEDGGFQHHRARTGQGGGAGGGGGGGPQRGGGGGRWAPEFGSPL